MSSKSPKRNPSSRKKLVEKLMEAAPRSATDGILLHQAIADRLGLHVTDLRCLQALGAAGRATAGELAERTGLTTGAVTRLIDRLESAGWVARSPDAEDRRRVIVTPIASRMEAAAPFYSRVAAGWRDILSGYDDEALALLVDLFDKMHAMSTREIARVRCET